MFKCVGLYNFVFEYDLCGVVMVVDMYGCCSCDIVDKVIIVLFNFEYWGV